MGVSAFDVAHDLFNKATSDAELKAAVSRAYIAAFQHAMNHPDVIKAFAPNRTGEDHKRLIKFLGDSSSRLHNRAAAAMRRLRAFRNEADYEATPFNKVFAKESLDLAAEVIFELLPTK
jgi:hypothetical protein